MLHDIIDRDENQKIKGVDMAETVVLCGSTKVLKDIMSTKRKLEELGYLVLIPEECIKGLPKKIASKAHFNRIIEPQNKIILVVNATKNDIKNYIGPNSFAEIAMAFQFDKDIYILNDIYEPYQDELLGWGVKPLFGDLSLIKRPSYSSTQKHDKYDQKIIS